jgi:hypothetical protein
VKRSLACIEVIHTRIFCGLDRPAKPVEESFDGPDTAVEGVLDEHFIVLGRVLDRLVGFLGGLLFAE